jgi:hypothetical protein
LRVKAYQWFELGKQQRHAKAFYPSPARICSVVVPANDDTEPYRVNRCAQYGVSKVRFVSGPGEDSLAYIQEEPTEP